MLSSTTQLTTTSVKKIINVASLDFDGCVANRAYKSSESPDKLVECNTGLFTRLIDNVIQEHPDEIIFMIGSSRQDFYLDQEHFENGDESCFPVYNELPDKFNKLIDNKIPCRTDGYLLADTFGKQNSGDNFTHAIAGDLQFPFSVNPPELSKLSILYAQMHKVAVENPDATIIYDFYDDRVDIYAPLYEFFSHNTDLMPENVTLRIHDYHGSDVKSYKEIIQGTGMAQPEFEENILLIHKLTNYENILNLSEDNPKQLNIMSQLKCSHIYNIFSPTPLEQFKKCTIIKSEIRQLENEFKEAQKIFASKPDYLPFISAVGDFKNELIADIEKMQTQQTVADKIIHSDTETLVRITSNMLLALRQVDANNINKNEIYRDIINTYKNKCRDMITNTYFNNFEKIMSTAAVFLTGTFIGNQISNITSTTSKLIISGIAASASLAGSLLLFKPIKYLTQLNAIEELPVKEIKKRI